MKTKIIGLIVVILALVVIIFVRGAEPKSSEEDVVVGAILPMTGELSFIGQEISRGMQLALAEYSEVPLTLVIEDDKTLETTAAVNALHKLLTSDESQVVFNSGVNTQKALDPILSKAQVPGIVLWDSNETIRQMSSYSYALGYSTEFAGEDMARFAYQELGARSVVIISSIDEWSEVISESFAKEFTRLGGTLVMHERTKVSETDFRTVVTKLREKNPDVMYMPLTSQPIEILIRQARQIGFTNPILTGDSFSDVNITNLGNLAEGIYVTQMMLENREFYEKYTAKYGTETNPTNLAFAGLGYDGVTLIAEIAKELRAEGKEVTRETIQTKLPGFRINGVSGLTQISEERTAPKRESILVIRSGKFEVAKKY